MNIELLLSRMQKVKATGKHRWICQCPAHQDKSPSLALSITDDGKVLMNCFAGCDTYSILQSVGLDWDAIFPEKPNYQGDKQGAKPQKQVLYASEALELIHFECMVVWASAYAMRNGTLNDYDLDRLEISMDRITKANRAAGQ